MTDLQLHIKPCPYCGRTPSIERALYARSGAFITKESDRTEWIAKCTDCAVITMPARTRLGAIIAWNRREYNNLSRVMNTAGYTDDMDAWYKLRDSMILMQTADLEKAALQREVRKSAGGAVGSKLKGESWFYSEGYKRLMGPPGDVIVKGIKLKAPYDYWKLKMGCRHCAVKEGQCPHKADNSLWRQYVCGTAPGCMKRAPGCPRREGDDCT